MRKELKGILLLLLTAAIWGLSFIAQSAGVEKMRPITFNGVRTLIGAVSLLPVVYLTEKSKKRDADAEKAIEIRKNSIKSLKVGFFLGLIFCAATNIQTLSIVGISPGKVAFITALYIFLVPLFGLFFGNKVRITLWICIAAAMVGLYFLCFSAGDGLTFGKYELFALICSFFFAAHILTAGMMSDCDSVIMSFSQFVTSGILTVIIAFIFEKPSLSEFMPALIPLLYSGIFSCGIAYTLQIVGQKYVKPAVASLLLSLESVFAAFFAAMFGKGLTGRELLGAGIMFTAIVVSQLFEFRADKNE